MAALLVILALIVLGDSLRVGIGWAEDGPQSGYFPFYIGLMLLASSGIILVKALLSWRGSKAVFAQRSELADVMAILVPMVIYVAAIAFIGIYLASFVLIAFFMRRHGKFGWPLCATVAIGVPLVLLSGVRALVSGAAPEGPHRSDARTVNHG